MTRFSTLRRSRVGVATLALALSAGMIATTAPAQAAEPGNVAKAKGYSLSLGKASAGRFIGTYGLAAPACTENRCASVAIDPEKALAGPYDVEQLQYTGDLDGVYDGPNARQTARVAYLMSRYGTTKSPRTAAALDAAVVSVLKPASPWAYNKAKGKKRLQATGASRKVTGMVKRMMSESQANSGPYDLKLNAKGANGAVQVYVTAKSLAGKPVKNRKVAITLDGEGPYSVTTNRRGKASMTLGDQTAGEKAVSATMSGLNDWRMYVSSSTKAKKTRLALAGSKVSVTSTTTASVKGAQRLTFKHNDTVAPANFTTTVNVTGHGGDRNLRSSLHGPYPTEAAANAAKCGDTAKYTATGTVVNENGSYPLATGPSSSGYWTYKATVSGNGANSPVTACTAPFAVKAQAAIKVNRDNFIEDKNGQVSGKLVLSGVNDANAKKVTVRLYGPFDSQADVGCQEPSLARSYEVTVNNSGSYKLPTRKLKGAGWYGWRANLAGSALATNAASDCPPTGKSTFQAR